jgi:hypothetical protein
MNEDPTPGSGATSSSTDPDTVAAVQTALGTEHAAVWSYSLIAAFLSAQLDQRAQQDLAAHRARRDSISQLLAESGVQPAVSEPAYRTPVPVTDQNSAIQLAQTAESDSAAAWHSVLERCDDPGLRRTALDALTDAAVRGAYWSGELGTKPVVPPFPGQH